LILRQPPLPPLDNYESIARCYGAYVRGKVRSLRLAQLGPSSEVERGLDLGARAYFNLAWAHAAGLTQPMVVVTMGLPASGKTTLAHALASNLDLVYLSSRTSSARSWLASDQTNAALRLSTLDSTAVK
jgi:hypothetical protein